MTVTTDAKCAVLRLQGNLNPTALKILVCCHVLAFFVSGTVRCSPRTIRYTEL